MSNDKSMFEEQILSLQKLSSIYHYLKCNAPSMDGSSLLRAEYVLIISAFDNYLHRIVTAGVQNRFFGSEDICDGVSIPLQAYRAVLNEENTEMQRAIFGEALKGVLEKDSFQSPKNVEYALGLIGIKNIWSSISKGFNDTATNIKKSLSIMVKRRNQIAHESDMEASTAMARSISPQDVEDCRRFIGKLVSEIDKLVS